MTLARYNLILSDDLYVEIVAKAKEVGLSVGKWINTELAKAAGHQPRVKDKKSASVWTKDSERGYASTPIQEAIFRKRGWTRLAENIVGTADESS